MKKVNFEDICEFRETGICKVHIDLLVKVWDSFFYISQYHDEFALGRMDKTHSKITISEAQARKLIELLDLLPVKSSMFRHAKMWKSEGSVLSEIDRIKKLLRSPKNVKYISMLNDELASYADALKHVNN